MSMTHKEIQKTLVAINSDIEKKQLKDAFDKIRIFLKDQKNWALSEELTELENNYRYMIHYFIKGNKDPQQRNIYNQLLRRTYTLAQDAAEKQLSQNIYERGVDDKGFGRIRSKGDTALFGGHTTEDMKNRLGIKSNRPLADFLPTLTIAAKNLATEMTNYNVETKNLHGEQPITQEHIENNAGVREMLEKRGIKPENLPPDEDIKKLERRVAAEEKQIEKASPKLPKNKKKE
jgi:Ni,Fe-hydrogenase III component G